MLKSLIYLLIPFYAYSFNHFHGITDNFIKIRGSTKPLEFFDPLKLSEKKDRIVYFREAELKHGRIAMVSTLLIPFFDKMDPNVLGIHGFDHLSNNTKFLIISHMFMAEFASIFKGWENPLERPFTLKNGYQPGDLGFRLPFTFNEDIDILMDKELNNGRLAMIGCLGMIAQELVTQQHLF